VQPRRAIGTGSAASTDRHPPVRLGGVILIELGCYLRRLGCGHDSPIARHRDVWPAATRKDQDPARDEQGVPFGAPYAITAAAGGAAPSSGFCAPRTTTRLRSDTPQVSTTVALPTDHAVNASSWALDQGYPTMSDVPARFHCPMSHERVATVRDGYRARLTVDPPVSRQLAFGVPGRSWREAILIERRRFGPACGQILMPLTAARRQGGSRSRGSGTMTCSWRDSVNLPGEHAGTSEGVTQLVEQLRHDPDTSLVIPARCGAVRREPPLQVDG
jgi:hypothetical protein